MDNTKFRLNKKVIRVRQKLSESQSLFAQRFGVSRSTVEKWEAEERKIPDNVLCFIKDVLGE